MLEAPMNENPKLVEYATQILQASAERSEGAFSRAADSFEDDLLDFPDFPKDYFEFILSLLSEERFFSRPGTWNFLLVLSTEKEKLLSSHYEKLAETILANYAAYLNDDLCLGVCDFIARNYPESYARQVLHGMKEIEKKKYSSLLGFAEDGLRILEREVARMSNTDKDD